MKGDEGHRVLAVSTSQKNGDSAMGPLLATASAAAAARPGAALAGAAVLAACALLVSLGGLGLGFGGLGTLGGLGAASSVGATGIAGATLPSYASGIAGLAGAAAMTAGSLAFRARRKGRKDSGVGAATTPLLLVDGCRATPTAKLVSSGSSSIEEEQTTPAAAAAPGRSRSPASQRAARGEPRDPYPRGSLKRSALLRSAQKRVTSWVTVLVKGVVLTVNGEPSELRLTQPGRTHLSIGSENASVLPLVGLALRLEGPVLRLVVAALPQAGGVGGGEDRTFAIEFDSDEVDMALELALTLKTLRANADSGAGVLAWGERPADSLKRPPPAE